VGLPGLVPDGELTLSVCEPEGDLAPASTIWVDVLSGGRKSGRAWARVEVSRSRAVVVLARGARKGDVVRSEDLEVRTPKGAPPRSALTDPGDAVGKRLVRSLPAGAPLSAGDVAVQPLVEKGDLVRLVVKVGSVTATTTGRAAESGRAGDQVRVENPASGRVVQGTLLESGIVEVHAGLER
jgi:flagella basal body P-ring formation protein FlgA